MFSTTILRNSWFFFTIVRWTSRVFSRSFGEISDVLLKLWFSSQLFDEFHNFSCDRLMKLDFFALHDWQNYLFAWYFDINRLFSLQPLDKILHFFFMPIWQNSWFFSMIFWLNSWLSTIVGWILGFFLCNNWQYLNFLPWLIDKVFYFRDLLTKCVIFSPII